MSTLLSDVRAEARHPARSLNFEEIVAVVNYSHDAFTDINQALWSGEWGENPLRVEHQILGLLSALNGLPAYVRTVERGEFLDAKASDYDQAKRRFDSFVVGRHFAPKGFWSASRGQSVAARGHFLNYALMVYKIESRTGRSIEKFSSHGDEEEVLFRPLTTFVIVAKREVPNSRKSALFPFENIFEVTLRETAD